MKIFLCVLFRVLIMHHSKDLRVKQRRTKILTVAYTPTATNAILATHNKTITLPTPPPPTPTHTRTHTIFDLTDSHLP